MSSENYRGFTESFVVETYPDGKLHRYFTQFDMDSDKNDILTTATLTCPYDKTLMAYWEPANMSCRVYGGVFDQEIIFSGRVREVEQTGYSIQITLDNIGWKFKQQADANLVANLVGQPIEDVLHALFSILGLKYSINLDGIPNLKEYTLGDGGSVKFGGETVEEIPELGNVIENLGSYNIDELVAKTKSTKSTIESAKEYNEKKEILALSSVLNARKYYTPTDLRNNWTMNDNVNLKTAKTITDKNQLQELSELYVKGLNKKSSSYQKVAKEYEQKAAIKRKEEQEAIKKAQQASTPAGTSSESNISDSLQTSVDNVGENF